MLDLNDLEGFSDDEEVEMGLLVGESEKAAAIPPVGRDLPTLGEATPLPLAGGRPAPGTNQLTDGGNPESSGRHRTESGRHKGSKDRKRSGADGSEKGKESRSKRHKASMSMSEELAHMRARGSELLRSEPNLLDLPYDELRAEAEQGALRVSSSFLDMFAWFFI